jgi:hypothetical protein
VLCSSRRPRRVSSWAMGVYRQRSCRFVSKAAMPKSKNRPGRGEARAFRFTLTSGFHEAGTLSLA